METLLYVAGFIIGILGTSFLLYYLKTSKLLRTQHHLILDLTFALIGKGIKKEKDDADKTQEKKAKNPN